jgi:hypothetical protein
MAFLFETTNDALIGAIIILFYAAPIIVTACLVKKIANALERTLKIRD